MKTRSRCVLGLSVHTGWAACVVAGGSVRAPLLAAREEIELLGDLDRFVYHSAAAAKKRSEAEASVARARKMAAERATDVLARLVERASAGGHAIVACAIVAKKGEMLPLENILAAHLRIHAAEAHLYRDVLRDAAEAIGLPARIVSPSDLETASAMAMRVNPSELPALLVEVGRAVGRPWAKDQRAASLAAWMLLADPGSFGLPGPPVSTTIGG